MMAREPALLELLLTRLAGGIVMLFRKQNAGGCVLNMKPVIFLPLMIAVMIALTACTATKGSIMILENANGTGFTMEFKELSARNKCELSLEKDDELQIEISRDEGEIALTISGKNGSDLIRERL
jgi:nitrogen regulatory protein PII-like uncharacterized protein